jgi:hypothetical protein
MVCNAALICDSISSVFQKTVHKAQNLEKFKSDMIRICNMNRAVYRGRAAVEILKES